MDLLKSLLRKGDDTELHGQPEQKNTQIEPELFMEAEILIQDPENDKVLIFLCGYSGGGKKTLYACSLLCMYMDKIHEVFFLLKMSHECSDYVLSTVREKNSLMHRFC